MDLLFGDVILKNRKQLIQVEEVGESKTVAVTSVGALGPDPVDTIDISGKSYEDVLKELKSLIPDMNNPKTIEEKIILVSYLNKILQCDDLPDTEGYKYMDMAKYFQEQIDNHIAENGIPSSNIENDAQLQEKIDELAKARAERDALVIELNEVGKQGYSYDQLMSVVNEKGRRINDLQAQIKTLTSDIANYMAAKGPSPAPTVDPANGGENPPVNGGENPPVNGGTTEVVENVILDVDGNKIGETVYVKDADGKVISETVYKYDSSGNKISETSVTRDDKGNITHEEVVNYKNNNPSGYVVNDYEYDENDHVVKETTKNLDTGNERGVASTQIKEHSYDEKGNEIATTYTTLDRTGKPTSSVKDEFETYTKEDGSIGTRLKSRTSFTYDKGELTGSTKTEHGYDEAGNKISEETTYCDKDGKEISGTIVTYDAEGKVTGRKTISYIRDNEGNITLKRTVDAIDPNSGVATHEIIETFDKEGNRLGTDDITTVVGENGNKLSASVINYTADGVKKFESEVEYDAKGNNILHETTVNFDEAGNKIGSSETKNVFRGDEQLDSQETVEKDADGNVISTSTMKCEYDENGKILSENWSTTNKDGVEIQSAKNTYDYNSVTGELQAVETFETIKDDNGNTVKEKRTIRDAQDTVLFEETLNYNENGISSGDIIRYNEDGSIKERSHYEVEYDENGARASVKTDELDETGTKKIKTTIESTNRDEAGQVVSTAKTVIEYDEDGNPVREKTIVSAPDGKQIDEINAVYNENGERSETHVETKEEYFNVTNSDGTKILRKRVIETEKDSSGKKISETKSEIDLKTQEIIKSSKDEFNEKGIRVKNTTYTAENGEANGKPLSSTTVTTYDEETGSVALSIYTENKYPDGSLASTDNIENYADGSPKTREINIYDEAGNLKTHTLKSVDINENETIVLDQYKDGVKTKSTSTTKVKNPDETKTIESKEVTEYTYTENGITAVKTVTDKDGKVVSVETIYLDADFNPINGTSEEDEPAIEEDINSTDLPVVAGATVKIETSDGKTVSKLLDASGKPIAERIEYVDSNGKPVVELIRYDANGNPIRRTISSQRYEKTANGTSEWFNTTSVALYDEKGFVETETNTYVSQKTGNVTKVVHKYERDDSGRITTGYADTFDKDGNLTSKEKIEYTYGKDKDTYFHTLMSPNDEVLATDEVVTEKDSNGNVIGSTSTNVIFHSDGGRTETISSLDADGKPLSETTVVYDKDNNEISRKTVDANGNPITGEDPEGSGELSVNDIIANYKTTGKKPELEDLISAIQAAGINDAQSVEGILSNLDMLDQLDTVLEALNIEKSYGSNHAVPPASTGEKVDPTGVDPATLDFSKHTAEKPASTDIPYVAGSKTTTETKDSYINGKKGTVETTTQTAPDGSIIKRLVNKNADGSIDSISLIKYDSNGNIISSVSHNNYGTDNAFVVETYKDANGRTTSEKQYSLDASGNVKEFHLRTWTYNADGTNTKTETDYDKDGNVTGINITKRGKDPNGKETLLAISNYDKDGNLTSTKDWAYNAVTDDKSVYCTKTEVTYKEGNAKVVTITKYNRKNEELATRTEEYDKNGNLTVVREYDKKTSSSRTERYYYDSEGNPTYAKIEVDERDESKHSVSNTTITIYYNSDGTREEITSVYDNSTGETTKTKKLYDANGNPINS